MSSIEAIWYCCVVLACLIALADWRRGLYAGILIDVLRDPIRKLIPEQPVVVTLSGSVVWLVIVAVAAFARRNDLRTLFRNYPGVRTAVHLLIIALLPAFGISAISYHRGWLMATIGAASYVIPMLGIVAGFALCRTEESILGLLRCYVIVNAIMLISVPMEYLKMEIPALGGIDAVWIRYRPGVIVDLMCGWYRSPDSMGLHAAHVIMFSLLLAIRKRSNARPLWIVSAVWAAFCVLLSGRRKMIGIPLVFVATFLLLGMMYRVARVSRLAGVSLLAAALGGAVTVYFWSTDEASDYTDYATSLFTEGGERANALIVSGTITTLKQSGIIGAGLGTATQGRHYANVQTSRSARGWQEDGISRLFLEFGVPGVLLLFCSLCLVIGAIAKSMRLLPPRSSQILLQLGLIGIICGDAASYAISHQQFSGDPVSALLVTMMIGMVLGLPASYYAETRLREVEKRDAGRMAVEQKPAALLAGLSSGQEQR
ncbi:MAG: hypothetical protein RIK87_30015 [Fuerstiella sp.]